MQTASIQKREPHTCSLCIILYYGSPPQKIVPAYWSTSGPAINLEPYSLENAITRSFTCAFEVLLILLTGHSKASQS